MFCFNYLSLTLIATVFVGEIFSVQAQTQSTNSCNRLYRHTRRSGMFVGGQLKIPVDSQFPLFKLEVKLSKPVHSFTIRQMNAKDTGAHQQFVIDSMALVKNGLITLNSMIRLRSIFGSLPRVTQIIHNGKRLCGAGSESFEDGDGDSVSIDLLLPSVSTSSTTETIFYRYGFDGGEEDDEDDENEAKVLV